MFHDVSDAGAVGRRRAEGDAEDFVIVFVGQVLAFYFIKKKQNRRSAPQNVRAGLYFFTCSKYNDGTMPGCIVPML